MKDKVTQKWKPTYRVPLPRGSNAISGCIIENKAVLLFYAQSLYFDEKSREVPIFLHQK
jgi:hypothetical protein